MMAQRRLMSALEAGTNVALGWLIALGVQLVAFPVVGLQATLNQHLAVSGIFTMASLVRSYALRRLFLRLEGTGG